MDGYLEKIAKALDEKKKYLNSNTLLKLQDYYEIQAATTKGVLDILLRKRLIHSDPYKYDSKMVEIELPEVSSFSDGERASVIGTRLSHYEIMLNFVSSNYQFKCEFLNSKRLALLESLNNVFAWDNFSAQSESPNTANLASLAEAVYNSPDAMSANILRNSIPELGKTLKAIEEILSKLIDYQKEKYKLVIKAKVFPEIPDDKKTPGTDVSLICKEVKKLFNGKFKKNIFYKDLISQAVNEEFGPNADALKMAVLKKLTESSEEASKKEKVEVVNFRPLLISGLKTLASPVTQFTAVLEKIEKNDDTIKKNSKGFFSIIARAFRMAFNIREPEVEISVITNDSITQSKKKQIINLTEFKSDMKRKVNIFNNILDHGSAIHKKINQIPEEDLLQSFSQYIQDCNRLLIQMAAIDQYYKTVKPEVRNKILGIKVEITTIKNAVVNANQYKAEYCGHVEEEKQMKILGVN